MDSVIPFPQICKDCRAPCSGNFKKVINLKKSGLVIIIHHGPDTEFERKTNREIAVLLHNISGKELKRPQFIGELCQYKTKCIRCVNLIKHVGYLLEEISDLRENEALSLCDYCRNSKQLTKCKRCNYILQKYNADKILRCQGLQHFFNTWMSKTKQVLSTFEGNVTCKQDICDSSRRIDELDKLLHDFRCDSPMRNPEITMFPDPPPEYILNLNDFSASKKMLEKLLMKLKNNTGTRRLSSDDSLYVSPSSSDSACVCKYLKDRLLKNHSSLDEMIKEKILEKEEKIKGEEIFGKEEQNFEEEIKFGKEEKNIEEKNKIGKMVKKGGKETFEEKKILKNGESLEKRKSLPKTPSSPINIQQQHNKKKGQFTSKVDKTKKLGDEENLTGGDHKGDSDERGKVQKTKKYKSDSQTQQFLKMLKDSQNKDRTSDKKPTERVAIPIIDKLPEIIMKPISVSKTKQELSFGSILECGQGGKSVARDEMVKGTKIVPLLTHSKKLDEEKTTLFKIETFLPSLKPSSTGSVIMNSTTTDITNKKTKSVNEDEALKGVLKYRLSNREFIDKGWTKLPTTKIMQRMNVYKMIPANSENDWFERHKNEKTLTYDTGEKLAEIREDGTGTWYYKNGNIALDYYKAEELNALRRYVVYSSGTTEFGSTKSTTVLGLFDYLGNGVVYDDNGCERLKYNQSEGTVIDSKIGPPGKWQWHSLNEPAVFQTVFIDTFVKRPIGCLQKIISQESSKRTHNSANDEMLSIELENFIKEKHNKLKQEFKPFQIRMKACKLNDYFSLKVIDQGNIHLLYRCGTVNMKLNLGMVLLNNEIIDTDLSDLGMISTSYDKNPAKSDSVALIQKSLLNARGAFKREVARKVVINN